MMQWGLDTQRAGTTVSILPGSVLEMQNPGPRPRPTTSESTC